MSCDCSILAFGSIHVLCVMAHAGKDKFNCSPSCDQILCLCLWGWKEMIILSAFVKLLLVQIYISISLFCHPIPTSTRPLPFFVSFIFCICSSNLGTRFYLLFIIPPKLRLWRYNKPLQTSGTTITGQCYEFLTQFLDITEF